MLIKSELNNFNMPVLEITGRTMLSSLRSAATIARDHYLKVLTEPDIKEPEKKAFTNEVNIMQYLLKHLKILDHELSSNVLQGSKKESDCKHQ